MDQLLGMGHPWEDRGLRESGFQPRATPGEGLPMQLSAGKCPAVGRVKSFTLERRTGEDNRASTTLHPPRLILHRHGTHNGSDHCMIISSI